MMKKLQKTTLAIAAILLVSLFAFKPSTKKVDPTKTHLTLIANLKKDQVLFIVQDDKLSDTLIFKNEPNIENDFSGTFYISPKNYIKWFPYDELYITKRYNEYTINTVPRVTVKYDPVANTVYYDRVYFKIKDQRFKDLHQMATRLDQGNPIRVIIQK